MSEKTENKLENFTIGGMYYKTLLTKKFKNRQPYEEPDSRFIKAFIPGTIVDIQVKKGQKVSENEPLLLLEAMKMRNIITAPVSGKIKRIAVRKGEVVSKNQLLIEMED